MSDVYYAKYLLRYLRTREISREADNYGTGLRKEFTRAALWVTNWETVSEEIEPQWKDMDEPLNAIYIRVKEILQVNKVSKFAKPEKKQTRECV